MDAMLRKKLTTQKFARTYLALIGYCSADYLVYVDTQGDNDAEVCRNVPQRSEGIDLLTV